MDDFELTHESTITIKEEPVDEESEGNISVKAELSAFHLATEEEANSEEVELKPLFAVFVKEEKLYYTGKEKEMEKKTKLRFSVEDDLNLLKETLACNPYADRIKWKDVHSNFMKVARKQFSFRAVKEHVEYLLNLYIKEGSSKYKKSGTEEEYGEREQLLEELNSLRREFHKSSRKETVQKGIESRRLAADALQNDNGENCNMELWELPETILESENVEENSCQDLEIQESSSNCEFPSTSHVPSSSSYRWRRQSFSKSISDLLKEKKERDWDLESRKLDIEQQKIDLERRKIALEEAKFEQLKVTQNYQNKLLEKLIDNLLNKN